MGKKKLKTETKPTVAEPLNSALTDYTGQVRNFMGIDPAQFVAPASPLQEKAFAGAGDLGGWQTGLAKAQDMLQAADALPAAQATAVGYTAPQLGAPMQATAATAQAAQLAPAHQAGRVQLGPNAQQQAYLAGFQDLLSNGGIQRYVDPHLDALVNSSLASYDNNTAKAQAAMRAQQAKSGAFGGSRAGVQQATFDAEAGLGRGQLEGGLRRDAFTQGAQLAMSDAQRRSGIDLANAATLTNVSGRNANAADQFALSQAGFDQQRNLFNTGALNDFSLQQGGFNQQANLANSGYAQQANLFNAGAANDFKLQQAGLDANAAQFGADAENRVSLANAGFQEADMQRALQAAGIYGGLENDAAANMRADLGLNGALGDVQRGIASEYANALPVQLTHANQFYGGLYPAYVGSKGTQTQSGGLGSAILGGLASGIGAGLMSGTKPWILGR